MGMGMGPGGDSAFNGAGFRPQSDEPNVNEGRTGPEGGKLCSHVPFVILIDFKTKTYYLLVV